MFSTCSQPPHLVTVNRALLQSGAMLACSAMVMLLVVAGLTVEGYDWCSHTCKPTFPGVIMDKHTLCKHPAGGGGQCRDYKMGLSVAEKDFIVNYHNERRAFVANGEEKRGLDDPSVDGKMKKGVPQPSAADMMELVWDDEVAMIAQRWADQCQYTGHDSCRETSDGVRVGQNTAGMSGTGYWDRRDVLKHHMDAWYNEVKDFVTSDVDSVFRRSPTRVGHYTQVLWARTRRIGCGLAHLSTRAFDFKLVCNYKPAGNTASKPLYIRGQPASQCPKTTFRSTDYPGLCASNGNDDFSEPSETLGGGVYEVHPMGFSSQLPFNTFAAGEHMDHDDMFRRMSDHFSGSGFAIASSLPSSSPDNYYAPSLQSSRPADPYAPQGRKPVSVSSPPKGYSSSPSRDYSSSPPRDYSTLPNAFASLVDVLIEIPMSPEK